jgi:hypothetical protein
MARRRGRLSPRPSSLLVSEITFHSFGRRASKLHACLEHQTSGNGSGSDNTADRDRPQLRNRAARISQHLRAICEKTKPPKEFRHPVLSKSQGSGTGR